MGFGRNPHVPKAQAAEQKAADAADAIARAQAYRDAAHQWDRAAERENPGRQRDDYKRKAEANRMLADGDAPMVDANEGDVGNVGDVGDVGDVVKVWN